MTYPINEIFYSLQGEGYMTGTPAIFIRFSGCNLRCPFCDTDFSSFEEMTLGQILEQIKAYPAETVILTGGEPSLQKLDPLINKLHSLGKKVHIETNGTNRLPVNIDWITLSPKQGSRISADRWDELKIVYTGSDPRQLWENLIAKTEPGHLFIQPCSGQNIPQTIEFALANPAFRLSLQTHKILEIR